MIPVYSCSGAAVHSRLVRVGGWLRGDANRYATLTQCRVSIARMNTNTTKWYPDRNTLLIKARRLQIWVTLQLRHSGTVTRVMRSEVATLNMHADKHPQRLPAIPACNCEQTALSPPSSRHKMMMMFIGTETLVTQLVHEISRMQAC